MSKITRRKFIAGSATAAAGTFVLPRFAIGTPGPSANSKLNVAMIGAGGVAGQAFGGCKGENIVALADVDSRKLHQHAERHPEILKARTFSDFRVMLDTMGNEIDAVCISTPDHTHFVGTIDAMQRGKHVCTQKPLTHNIWESRTLIKAKEKYGVVTNMANQGHTGNGIRQMREWYDAGVFGQVNEVHLGFPGPGWDGPFFKKPPSTPLPEQPIPEHLDWDLWLGPRMEKPYHEIYHPLTWRGFYEYGTGQFGDWFCHTGDGPVWALDLFDPVVIECINHQAGPVEGMVADHSVVRFEFPARGDKAPCTMYWYDGMKNGGTQIKAPEEWDIGNKPGSGSVWYGDKQNGYLGARSDNPRLTTRQAMMDFNKGADIPQTYERIQGGPFREWIRAIKGEGPEPGSNFDYAARLTEVSLLGVIAQRFNCRIEWDPIKGEITNHPELNVYVREPVRKGWEYGADLWKS